MAEKRKDRPEINDRTQWNSSSGRENVKPRFHGPQVLPSVEPTQDVPQHGVKFTIGENQARNLASRK